MARPTRSSRAGSQVAPRIMATGNAVARSPVKADTPRGPSSMRSPGSPRRAFPATSHAPSTTRPAAPCIKATFSAGESRDSASVIRASTASSSRGQYARVASVGSKAAGV
jgi:hypothetical protein